MTRASLDKKPADVAAMFDGTAVRYDLLNTLMTGGQDRRWRREAVRALDARPGERILDVGPGTVAVGRGDHRVGDAGGRRGGGLRAPVTGARLFAARQRQRGAHGDNPLRPPHSPSQKRPVSPSD